MGSDTLPKLLSLSQSALWIGLSLFVLFSLNQSLLAFLTHIQPPSPNNAPNLIMATAELVRFLLHGWLFFTVFFRPKSRSVLPSKEIRQNMNETQDMLNQVCFVALWSVIILDIGTRLGTERVNGNLPLPVFVILCVGAVVWTMLRLRSWRRTKLIAQRRSADTPNPAILLIQAGAWSKIEQALTTEEQQELALLIYESEATSQTTVQGIARIVMASLAFMLIGEIIQEIFGRL